MRARGSAIRLHIIQSAASLYNAYALKNKTFYFPNVSIGRIIIMYFHVSKKKNTQHMFFHPCSCDQGGDCECLCTALSNFAEHCNRLGHPSKWRSRWQCRMLYLWLLGTEQHCYISLCAYIFHYSGNLFAILDMTLLFVWPRFTFIP